MENTVVENTKKRRAPNRWDADGVDGGKCSIDVLLDWITNPRNYQRWKGGGSRETKETLCGEIVSLLNQNGITSRKKADVRTKVQELINDYAKATDWLHRTGEGIRQKGLPGADKTIEGKYFDEQGFVYACDIYALMLRCSEKILQIL